MEVQDGSCEVLCSIHNKVHLFKAREPAELEGPPTKPTLKAAGELHVIAGGVGTPSVLVGPLRLHLSKETFLYRSHPGCYVTPLEGNATLAIALPKGLDPDQVRAFEAAVQHVSMLADDVQFDSALDASSLPAPSLEPLLEPSKAEPEGWYAQKIKLGGDMLAKGILEGSAKAGQGVKMLGAAVKSNTSAAAAPSRVGDTDKKIVQSAETASDLALQASRVVLSGAVTGFKFVGRKVAAATTTAATKLEVGGSESRSGKYDKEFVQAGELGGVVVTSSMNVLHALKRATWALVDDVSETTVEVVDHKYGSEYADVTSRALRTGTNLATAVLNVDALATSAVDVAVEVAIESADHLMSMTEWCEGPVLCCGDMEQLGTITGSVWTDNRWGVLRKEALILYTPAPAGRYCKPSEVVVVDDLKVVELGKGGRIFELKGRDSTIRRYQVATEGMCAAWVAAVQRAVDQRPRTQLLDKHRPTASGAS